MVLGTIVGCVVLWYDYSVICLVTSRTHLFTSIQCVLWKFLYLKGSWWPESPFMRNLCFSGFLHIRFRSKNLNFESILLPLSLNFSNELLIFLKSGLQWEVGGGGSQTLNWSVGASRDFCVRPKPKLATCVQTPGPSMAACWRSPLIRALCNQEEQLSAPISNPPLWLRPVSRILPKHIYSLVLTLTSALMRNHISWFQTKVQRQLEFQNKPFWLEQNMVTTLCIDCPPERRRCH